MIGPVEHVNKQSEWNRRGGAPHHVDVPLATLGARFRNARGGCYHRGQRRSKLERGHED
jgi:hypothetical protein